jgi:hypothetical protein
LKLAVILAHPYILEPHLPLSPYLLPCAWTKRKRKGETKRGKEIGSRNAGIMKVLPFLPPLAMVEQDWTPSSIRLGHLQKLMKHGFMSAVELETYQVLMDPVLPAPAEGYVVSFMAFYEQRFDVPLHPFLHSLLQYYGLELYHLTASGVLHIAVFITLCEAYLGVDPDLDLWKYFYCVHRP